MKLWAIITFTFREGLARKTIIAFAAISTFFLIIATLAALLVPSTMELGTQEQQQTLDLNSWEVVATLQSGLTGFITFVALVLAVFATAGILPRAMEKGSIDLLLSKPVSRGSILLGTTIGAVLIVAANVGYFVIGMWIISGLRSGYWNWGFLAVVLPISWTFLVLYTPMMTLSILSRGSALSITLVYVFVFLISPILESRAIIAEAFSNSTVKTALDVLYYPLPKPDAMSSISKALVQHQHFSWVPVWTDALFAVAMASLALWLFKRKDF